MRTIGLAALMLQWVLCGAVLADDGVTAHEIRIGMANALSGPAAGLGLQLRAGANAYFDKVNAGGGVHGRRLALVSVDDAYDPLQSIKATHALIDTDKVFALFGYVGTPTSNAAVPIASKAAVPYLFPFTGAQFLREPAQAMVFNLRASYFDEAEALVAHLTGTLGMSKIALFIQDDEFGEAGKAGVVRALRRRHLDVVLESRFRRNTIDVETGLAQLERHKPQAVIFIGTYRPLAMLLKKARAHALRATFATVSFIGTSEFIKHAGAHGNGVLISQVMPSPDDAADVLVKQYQGDVAPAARNYGSLEGYADAVVLVEALRRSGPAPSRTALLRTLEQMNMSLSGMALRFSAKDHQGMDQVYLTQVQDGKAVPLK